MGRDREPLRTGGELAAVDLVGDDRIGESQCIPVPQTAPLEDPMVGTADRVGARGSRDTEAVARVPATREGQPGRRGLGPSDAPVGPQTAQPSFVRRPEHRILVGPVLEGGHRAPLVVESDLPAAGVPAEDRGVAPGGGERIEPVAHPPGPILVVPDRDEEPAVL